MQGIIFVCSPLEGKSDDGQMERGFINPSKRMVSS
jgi:hypothetical protein